MDAVPDGDLRRCRAVVGYLSFHMDCDRIAAGIFRLDLRRSDIGAVVRNVNVFCDNHRHIAVNSASGVPAAAGLLIIDPNCNDVFSHTVCNQCIRNVIGKGGISVGEIADHRAVDIYRAVHINAVEVQIKPLIRQLLWEDTGLAVPSNTAIQIGTRSPGRRIGIEILLDAVVMRKIQITPATIVKIDFASILFITQTELPVSIKIYCLAIAPLFL